MRPMGTISGQKFYIRRPVMNEFDCLLCKAVLSVMTTSIVATALVRLASWYKYVQLFV